MEPVSSQLDLFQDMEQKMKHELLEQPEDNKTKLHAILKREHEQCRAQLTQDVTNTFLTRLEIYGRMKGLEYLLNTFYKTIKI